MRALRLTVLSLMLLLAGCGGGGGGGGAPVNAVAPDVCSVVEQNRFVNDVMRDIYYWVDLMPAADPASFDTPEALLDFLIYPDLDRFSGIVDAADEDAFFSDSQFIGVGMGIEVTDNDELWVTQAFADGPAAAAGIERGYQILQINGQTIPELEAGAGVSAAFGASDVGIQVDLVYLDKAGTQLAVTLFKALVTIETVSASAVFNVAGVPTGYLAFRNFVEPSFAALDAEFADLASLGVAELVLDLRYNGGGLISVAEFLANLLGGQPTAGQLFAQRIHNTANTFRNVDTRFLDETNALDLSRVVVITSGGTASASEMVINGLAPFVEVVLVGEDTFGKPVGSYGFSFCDKVLRPISFANENAVGNGDYFAGFGVDCVADDDLAFALGDPLEASLAEALYVIEHDTCSSPVPAAKRRGSPSFNARPPARSTLHELRNIY